MNDTSLNLQDLRECKSSSNHKLSIETFNPNLYDRCPSVLKSNTIEHYSNVLT